MTRIRVSTVGWFGNLDALEILMEFSKISNFLTNIAVEFWGSDYSSDICLKSYHIRHIYQDNANFYLDQKTLKFEHLWKFCRKHYLFNLHLHLLFYCLGIFKYHRKIRKNWIFGTYVLSTGKFWILFFLLIKKVEGSFKRLLTPL